MSMSVVSIIVDVVLALVVVIGMIVGTKRGFVKTVAAPVKLVAAIAFAFTVCEVISAKIIEPFIRNPITAQLSDFLHEKCAGLTADNVSTELPTLLKMSAGALGVDLEEIAANSVNSIIDSIILELTDPIVHIVGLIVSFVLAYIVAKLVLALLILLIDWILSSGPLGVINKALGFVFGTAFSVIISWALVVAADFVMGYAAFDFEAGYVYNFFRGFNLLDLLLSF